MDVIRRHIELKMIAQGKMGWCHDGHGVVDGLVQTIIIGITQCIVPVIVIAAAVFVPGCHRGV